MTPSVLAAVQESEDRIIAMTGLSRNDVRQIALWAILGDPDDTDAFIRDVIPDWHTARIKATQVPPAGE